MLIFGSRGILKFCHRAGDQKRAKQRLCFLVTPSSGNHSCFSFIIKILLRNLLFIQKLSKKSKFEIMILKLKKIGFLHILRKAYYCRVHSNKTTIPRQYYLCGPIS